MPDAISLSMQWLFLKKTENIKNKAYPITDNFYAITVRGKESESVKQFIQWILSNEGQKIVEEVGYVPIGNSKF